MLILQRKKGESLSINHNITLTVMETGADWVKLAVDAPKEIPILRTELKEAAAAWFHDKWKVPQEAYLECMKAYINNETEYGWYLCLDSRRIAGGLGVVENDFHDRKDLTPNVCAVYTEKEYRCQGIAGQLLDIVAKDMKSKGITPIYLITDHTSFYERHGWEFLCMVQGDNEPDMTRMYIHR